MCPAFLISYGRFFPRLGREILLLLCLAIPVAVLAADEGEVLSSAPVSQKTYTFTPGKLTGKQFWLENIEKKDKILCREFRFDQFLVYKKPAETVSVKLSLRGGYRPHDLFGHDDFEPKEAKDVVTGWVPQGGGSFIIYPDLSKEHSPKWIPERTKMIRVPFIKQYGETPVNAYDIALGLDRANAGAVKTIDFQLVPITDDNGKQAVRLVPTTSLTDGVYFAYSLPDGTDTDIYGFLFAVGISSSGSVNTATQAQSTAAPSGVQLVDAPLARGVMDYALLSQAVYKDESVPNWEKEDDGNCPISGMKCWEDIGTTGFQVQVYRQGKTLTVVFRGTEITKPEDIATDVENFFNLVPAQYVEATNFVQDIVNKAGSEYKIILTGHSLGGGLASFAALCCGQQAILFNSAGLGDGLRGLISVENFGKQKSLVKIIDLAGDPVSALGRQVGTIYTLQVPVTMIGQDGFVDNRSLGTGPLVALNPDLAGQPKATTIDLLTLHSIGTVVDVLKKISK